MKISTIMKTNYFVQSELNCFLLVHFKFIWHCIFVFLLISGLRLALTGSNSSVLVILKIFVPILPYISLPGDIRDAREMEVRDEFKGWRCNCDIHSIQCVDQSAELRSSFIRRILGLRFVRLPWCLLRLAYFYFCDIQVLPESNQNCSVRCDEYREFAELQCDALSGRLDWKLQAVSTFVFTFVFRLYVIVVGIVVHHLNYLLVPQVRWKYGE